jgi:hypothetical protein
MGRVMTRPIRLLAALGSSLGAHDASLRAIPESLGFLPSGYAILCNAIVRHDWARRVTFA